MGSLTRLLALVPRNMLVPVILLGAGWYGGAKYGAPDIFLNTIDGAVEEGSALVSGLLGDGEDSEGATTADG